MPFSILFVMFESMALAMSSPLMIKDSMREAADKVRRIRQVCEKKSLGIRISLYITSIFLMISKGFPETTPQNVNIYKADWMVAKNLWKSSRHRYGFLTPSSSQTFIFRGMVSENLSRPSKHCSDAETDADSASTQVCIFSRAASTNGVTYLLCTVS